jgi:hypothetical protein
VPFFNHLSRGIGSSSHGAKLGSVALFLVRLCPMKSGTWYKAKKVQSSCIFFIFCYNSSEKVWRCRLLAGLSIMGGISVRGMEVEGKENSMLSAGHNQGFRLLQEQRSQQMSWTSRNDRGVDLAELSQKLNKPMLMEIDLMLNNIFHAWVWKGCELDAFKRWCRYASKGIECEKKRKNLEPVLGALFKKDGLGECEQIFELNYDNNTMLIDVLLTMERKILDHQLKHGAPVVSGALFCKARAFLSSSRGDAGSSPSSSDETWSTLSSSPPSSVSSSPSSSLERRGSRAKKQVRFSDSVSVIVY